MVKIKIGGWSRPDSGGGSEVLCAVLAGDYQNERNANIHRQADLYESPFFLNNVMSGTNRLTN